jgi:hypothetical protein
MLCQPLISGAGDRGGALDRGYGRPMQGMELSEHEGAPRHTVIRVAFVTPPKWDEYYSVSQRPSLLSVLPEVR